MRIGVMLRHYEQHEGGVKLYTKKILPLLFDIGSQHQYVLMYQNRKLLGTYSNYRNVEEVVSTMPGTVLWDQVAVPLLARKKRVDVIFNPKFTVPLISRAKKVFVMHGSEWFVVPHFFHLHDQIYTKFFVPMYCRAADAFVSVSEASKIDTVRHAHVNPQKIVTIHNGFDTALFQPMRDTQRLQAARAQHKLPENYILWVGQIESRKNVARLLRAFAQIKDRVPHHLVLAGEQRWSTGTELSVIPELGIRDRLLFPGWVTQTDLPALYTMADLFAFPSLYEGFGIPLLEAMACGCPIVTADTCAPPEVTAGAACLVDPMSVDDIAAGMLKVLLDRALHADMAARGLERAQAFSWEKCVRQILSLLDNVSSGAMPGRSGTYRS